MPVDYLKMRVFLELGESDGPGTTPEHFVVVRFDEPFWGRPALVESKDPTSVSWGRVPLRYLEEDVDVLYESDDIEADDYYRAHAARALLALFDDLEGCSGSCIPTEIVIHSQSRPLVAMYLSAYQGMSSDEIGELFDVKSGTIRRYRRRAQRLARGNSSLTS